MLSEPNLSHRNNKTIKDKRIFVYNIIVIYALIKVSVPLQGVEWGVTSYQPDGSSRDSMTPTFIFNSILLISKRFAHVPIAKDLNEFF